MPGETVQVPSGVHLGTQHRIEPLRGDIADHGVVENSRGVHDRDQRMVFGDCVQYRRQGDRVRHVAGDDGGVAAQFGKFGRQLRRTRRGGSAAAGQHEVTYAVVGHQASCRKRAESAGSSGDQDGAVCGERERRRVAHVDRTPQPGHVGDAIADGDLGIVGPAGAAQRRLTRGGAVQIDQLYPARVFRLGRTHQTPHRCGL